MPELTLHFETDQAINTNAVVAEVQQKLPEIDGITTASADAMELRTLGGLEIIAVISIATTVVQNASSLVKAVADLVAACHALCAQFPGLRKPSVEIGYRKVPIDQVTEQDALEALGE
jgi:hypothetical protein